VRLHHDGRGRVSLARLVGHQLHLEGSPQLHEFLQHALVPIRRAAAAVVVVAANDGTELGKPPKTTQTQPRVRGEGGGQGGGG
jgi:hypothetical protein